LTGCFILANGRAPIIEEVNYFLNNGYPLLIAADGGADTCKVLGLTPDIIAGDFDSVSPETLQLFSKKSKIQKISGQYDTDVEKCIKVAISMGIKECVLAGATGDRLDHSFNNIGMVLKYFPEIRIKLMSESSILQVITGETKIEGTPGETVSLFGIDDNTLFTTEGLAFPLNRETLPFGKRDGTSNKALTGIFSVVVEGGKGILIRELEKMTAFRLSKESSPASKKSMLNDQKKAFDNNGN